MTTANIFEDFELADSETEEEIRLEAVKFREVCFELEDEFSADALRFTKPFHGAIPVQAYGWIKGERFYFRFRGDTATLRIGSVDPVKAQAEFDRKATLHGRAEMQREQREATGDLSLTLPKETEVPDKFKEIAIDRMNLVVETDFSVDAYPNIVTRQVSIPEYTGFRLNGVLSAAEAKDVFAKLVLMLEN